MYVKGKKSNGKPGRSVFKNGIRVFENHLGTGRGKGGLGGYVSGRRKLL